jgi:hypothetical protein
VGEVSTQSAEAIPTKSAPASAAAALTFSDFIDSILMFKPPSTKSDINRLLNPFILKGTRVFGLQNRMIQFPITHTPSAFDGKSLGRANISSKHRDVPEFNS